MEILQSSYAPGGILSIFQCYVDLDQPSTVYPRPPSPHKKLSDVSGIHPPPPPKKKKMKLATPPKIFQFCILTLRKSPRMVRNISPK